jgi:hypothetical protein
MEARKTKSGNEPTEHIPVAADDPSLQREYGDGGNTEVIRETQPEVVAALACWFCFKRLALACNAEN